MLANLQLEVGQLDEGIYRLETVLSLDPMAIGARGDLARALALLGQWDRAGVLLTLPIERPEDRFVRLVLRARFNLWRRAQLHDLSETPEGPYAPLLAHYIATVRSATFTAEARQHFEQKLASAHSGSRMRPLLCQLLAELHAYVGADDHALAAVEQAAGEALHDLSWLDHCPTLQPLREHPRFVAARDRVAARVRPVLAALA
jgi:serine/threonine-protein kinase